jgi:hypothetical protein
MRLLSPWRLTRSAIPQKLVCVHALEDVFWGPIAISYLKGE